MKRSVLGLVVCIVWGATCFAQPGFNIHVNPDGPAMTFYNILSLNDTLYAHGQIKNPDGNNWGLFLAKMDTIGNLLDLSTFWDHDGRSFTGFYGNSLLFTSEENFAFVSDFFETTGGMLFIIEKNGNLLFSKEYTFPYPDIRQTFQRNIIELDDGYIIAGGQQVENYYLDMYAIRTDEKGEVIWYKRFGDTLTNEFCVNISKSGENNFVLGGGLYNRHTLPIQDRWMRSMIIHFDTNGIIIDEWTSEENEESNVQNVILMNSNLFYSTNKSTIYDNDFFVWNPQVVNRDMDYNLIWKYTIETPALQDNIVWEIQLLSDGNLLAVGQWGDPAYSQTTTYYGGTMLKISPEGEKIWSRIDTVAGPEYASDRFRLCGIAELSSGSIIAAGGHTHYAGPDSKSYGWLVKVSSDGCMVDTLCTTTGLYEKIVRQEQLAVSPNPASDQLSFTAPEGGRLQVLSVTGEIIHSAPYLAGRHTIDCSAWPRGLYYLRLTGEKKGYFASVVVN